MRNHPNLIVVGAYLDALSLLFIALKLTGFIHWSWFFVTMPLWGPPALFVTVILLIVAIAATIAGVKHFTNRKRTR